jgi:hypothetical protein
MMQNQKLESAVRDGLVKHHQLLDECNRLREENANLMSSIVNFTQKMSSLHVPGQRPEPLKPVPIHPVVLDSENASGS